MTFSQGKTRSSLQSRNLYILLSMVWLLSITSMLLSCRSRQRERLSASVLSICLLVCLSVAKMQKNAIFSKTKQLELWCDDLYRKSYMGFSKNPLLDPGNPRWLRSTILKINMTSFFCRGRPNLDKISETGHWCRMTRRLW